MELETAEEMINTHVIRYEQMYKRLYGYGWNMLAMKVLKQKEKLLQIDKKRIKKREEDSKDSKLNPQMQFDPKGKLTPEEYKDFKRFMAMIKVIKKD